MRRRIVRAAGLAVLPTGLLVIVVFALPGRGALAFHIWLLVVVSLVLLTVVTAVNEAVPSADLRAVSRTAAERPAAAPPASLARLERELSMGSETSFDTHARLRPLFTALTQSLLLSHHRVDLERSPGLARGYVGDDVWSLVRPDAELPDRRQDPGMPRDAIERVVADLERMV